ncbi:MAG: hypothetical protein HRT54_13060 [Colwellia sp.]|nr:hypothetical protein [Colwellia sp.]
MTTEKTNSSQRKNRYTLYLNDSENSQVRDTAIGQGYGNKAIGRYIREQLLSSLNDVEKGPSITIPAINTSTAIDLRGAVTNLNQSVRTLNTIALSSSISSQKEEAEKMMVDVLKLAEICKQYKSFLDGDIENLKLLYILTFNNFNSKTLLNLAKKKAIMEAKK